MICDLAEGCWSANLIFQGVSREAGVSDSVRCSLMTANLSGLGPLGFPGLQLTGHLTQDVNQDSDVTLVGRSASSPRLNPTGKTWRRVARGVFS